MTAKVSKSKYSIPLFSSYRADLAWIGWCFMVDWWYLPKVSFSGPF
jgi:hypothetical protein